MNAVVEPHNSLQEPRADSAQDRARQEAFSCLEQKIDMVARGEAVIWPKEVKALGMPEEARLS